MTSRSLPTQRVLLTTLKSETCSNVSILSKVHPVPNELSKQIFKEHALEKPTQNVFIHLSYYLVLIIDAQKAATFTWPLYDTKSEKTYRSELSTFIAGYTSSGALAPVLSSYFVNPGCFKVIKLMYQLSHLAVQKALQDRMQSEGQSTLYNDAAGKFKTGSRDFLKHIEKETVAMTRKFQTYQQKKQVMVNASELLKKKILENEEKLATIKKQKFLPDLVDDFVKQHPLDDAQKTEFEKIKNVKVPARLFEDWLQNIDDQITQMELHWNSKVKPFLEVSQYCHETSLALILRHTGEMDKKMYMVEYDPKTDEISTKDLETHVNPNQKYILKNIIKDEKLNFPYLIRGFVVSICFLLKKKDMDDDIYQMNEYLEMQKRNFGEMVSALNVLLERVMDADTQLQVSPVSICDQTISVISEIPPLPDLSDLKATQTLQYHGIFDSFTPLNLSKHQFNLRRKASVPTFAKPQPRSLTTPFHTSRDDFLKGFNSCRANLYERPKLNMSQNISIISQGANRGNETIAECSSGFTKQQIQRLLSTKKTSSSKKHKFKPDRPKLVIKKGGLFHESVESSGALFRSHSSPNLFDNKEKRPASKGHSRKLSIMEEDASSLLEVSGIVALNSASNSGCGTPIEVANTSISRLLTAATSLPSITISPVEHVHHKFTHDLHKNKKECEGKVSGIVALNSASNGGCGTPIEHVHHKFTHTLQENKKECEENLLKGFNRELIDERTQLERPLEEKGTHKLLEFPVKINPIRSLQKFDQILKETEDLNHEFIRPHDKDNTRRKSTESLTNKEENPLILTNVNKNITRKSTDSLTGKEENSVTPKSKIPVRKTSSIEKIINRFKKVRASVVAESRDEPESIFKTILEEKENKRNDINIDVFNANRVLLPDLLSPSCSVLAKKSTDFIDTSGFDIEDEKPSRKPRESLGTMLGVDQTVLDQFDLID